MLTSVGGKLHADSEHTLQKKRRVCVSAAMHTHTHAYSVVPSQHMLLSVLSNKATLNSLKNYSPGYHNCKK